MPLTPEIAFETHREHLLSLIWLRMGPDLRRRMDPEDVLQEVAIEAIHYWHTLEDEANARPWLVTLTRRKLARIIRDQVGVAARDPRREHAIATDLPVADRRSGPVTVAARRERLRLLEEALQKLKPEYRDVILLARIEKLTAKEIGAEMGRSENAVHLLLGRAIKSLGRHLLF
jgi:RNA polymerase sigma-70 factor (ECF subfamily)